VPQDLDIDIHLGAATIPLSFEPACEGDQGTGSVDLLQVLAQDLAQRRVICWRQGERGPVAGGLDELDSALIESHQPVGLPWVVHQIHQPCLSIGQRLDRPVQLVPAASCTPVAWIATLSRRGP
jgi:hypothetical protein